ncbi:MAG TPA: 3-hydroxyacyl-CoA dehydrogenase NAD-binding domain-containing protein, partial [Solirubrobacteraceae bacterium]|nr:3-hydroxyacyl-CoA dehydrogenase NAD-binding domain-containing protein [Solirubrobacteraceae bacterium]
PHGGTVMGAAKTIGVVGAGTMGSGIGQLAAKSGARTLLHDPIGEALERGLARARGGLEKEAAKGRLSERQARDAAGRLEGTADLGAMGECELVIEAAPERLEIKHELFGALAEIVAETCVLASNTSSLPITAIATPIRHPERVVGMHFFNPAPLMALVEVVAGELSGEDALGLATETGQAMGKTTIRASDGPGFLVNRCNRPFGLEALRLLGEGVADVETIDRIVRMGGSFKMGPFELSDLVGVDTGFAVSRSFYELSFGEPRWRPSPIQAQRVAAGLHGRKSGRGYYDYGREPYREPDPAPRPAGGGEGLVVILGESTLARELREAAARAGYEVSADPATPRGLASLTVECEPQGSGWGGGHPASEAGGRKGAAVEGRGGRAATASGAGHPGRPDAEPLPLRPPATATAATAATAAAGEPRRERPAALRPPDPEPLHPPRAVLCAGASLGGLEGDGDGVGFHVFSPFGRTELVELTRSQRSSPAAVARAERFFQRLGKETVWVGDGPGLVLGRIVCQLVNEAAFALGEGVGSAGDIDAGMTLGLNHPRGPLEWADEIGLERVLGTLDGLWREYREERYRAAPVLRRLVGAGRLGRETGGGFFDYGAPRAGAHARAGGRAGTPI